MYAVYVSGLGIHAHLCGRSGVLAILPGWRGKRMMEYCVVQEIRAWRCSVISCTCTCTVHVCAVSISLQNSFSFHSLLWQCHCMVGC